MCSTQNIWANQILNSQLKNQDSAIKNGSRNWSTQMLNTLSSSGKGKTAGTTPNFEIETLEKKL